jgi:holo-[acyl-carrier protein] synthase
MNLAAGVDLVEIERIQAVVERYGERFLKRVFTPRELEEARRSSASLAVRFAAKEAVSKALKTGIGQIGWREIEVLKGEDGEPGLHLHGAASRRATQLGLVEWSVSLSHSRSQAVAVVVAFGP